MAGLPCPACGADALGPWRPGFDRCAACGSAVTLAPRAPDAHDLPRPRGASLAAPLLRAFDAHRLRLLRRGSADPPGGGVERPVRTGSGPVVQHLLDVGAGRGRFVLAARRAGWDAEGLEPAARDTLVPLHREPIESAAVVPGSLDAVTLWHVLEHLDAPRPALAAIATWLRPGGTLLVGVPNVASLQARLGGDRWFHLDAERHRVHLTPAGLRAALEAAGLEVVREHHVLLEHNPLGMWQTLLGRVTREPNALFRFLRRTARPPARDLVVSVLALPLAPVAGLVELAAGLARRGGTIAVVARRPPAGRC